MMGGIHTDIESRDAAARACSPPANAPASASTARTGSARTRSPRSWCSARRAALSAIEYLSRRTAPAAPAHGELAEAAQARIRELFERTGGNETVAGLRKEMMRHDGRARGHLPQRRGPRRRPARSSASCARRYRNVELHDRSNVYNTDLLQALELGCMLDCAEAVMRRARPRARSRAARTSGSTITERDDANFLQPHARRPIAADEPPRIDYRDVVITRSQPGVRDYSGEPRCMSDAVELEVLRYNPETDSEPHFQRYAVPYSDEWVVLDALNHVKETIDPTLTLPLVLPHGGLRQLRHDDQRRAEARLARPSCATTAGVIRVEPLAPFPDRARPRDRRSTTSWQARAREAVPDPEGGEAARRRRIPADAGAAEALQAVHAVHQLHAVLRGLPGIRADPEVHRPGGDRARAPLQPAIRATAGASRARRRSRADEGVWECTFVGACSEVCPEARRPRGRDPAGQDREHHRLVPGAPHAMAEAK